MNSGQPNPGNPMQLLINNLDALGQHSTQVVANASNWLEEKVFPQTLIFKKLAFELVPSNFKFPPKKFLHSNLKLGQICPRLRDLITTNHNEPTSNII